MAVGRTTRGRRTAGLSRRHTARSPERGAVLQQRAIEALPVRSAAKRRDVLSAAWELFGARGFGSTSMRDLAAEAAVSTATIYAHFPTKRDLLRALVTQRWEAALIGVVRDAAAVADPLERLLFAVSGLNRAIAADPLLCQLLVTPRRVGGAHLDAHVGGIEDMMDARCADLIRTAVAAGRLTCPDPDALAVLIRVSMQGWLLTEAKRPRPMSEARLTASLVALLRATKPTAARRGR
ncbi:MAG: helix-turn-helix domain-containing protein [bacterium]